jgi:hypothetical protein
MKGGTELSDISSSMTKVVKVLFPYAITRGVARRSGLGGALRDFGPFVLD